MLPCAVATVSLAPRPASNQLTTQLTTQLKQILDKHAAFWNASYSFAIANDSVEVAVAAGYDDHARGTNLTRDMQIPQGSTTKMYTAVAVMRLEEQGVLRLDDTVAPHIDRYLAVKLPCADAPSMCAAQCASTAPCWANRNASGCEGTTAETFAACSYCVRYFHCDAFQAAGAPEAVTLTNVWDNDPTIELVTFRHLLTMASGVKDYFFDRTNWLYREVMASTRDIEPLEYLAVTQRDSRSQSPDTAQPS